MEITLGAGELVLDWVRPAEIAKVVELLVAHDLRDNVQIIGFGEIANEADRAQVTVGVPRRVEADEALTKLLVVVAALRGVDADELFQNQRVRLSRVR